MNDLHDLTLVLTSHVPIVVIESHEEARALRVLIKAVETQGSALAQWTITDGLQSISDGELSAGLTLNDLQLVGHNNAAPQSSTDPQAALRKIKAQTSAAVFVLFDFHPHLDDAITIRLLKEIALNYPVCNHTLVFISHQLSLPDELSRFSASFELSMPNEEKLRSLLVDQAKLWTKRNQGSRLQVDPTAMDLLVKNLIGLTETDASRLIRNAIYRDGAISHDDIPAVQKAKYELIGQDGLLSFEYETAHFKEVGGLAALKQWLARREPHFVNIDSGSIDSPKGILLVGVQGGGKSLAAKAVAGAWNVPLLRLDFGTLYNKFFGETEKNIREALKMAQVMSPCVLWIDEIEKGLATGAYDSGTSRRVLGTLLTWMAENKSKVFLVATANDIQSLPPELIRKGRMDEIFFVDLPNCEVREEIFVIHLRKRNYKPEAYNLQMLAEHCDGFSGAEIEQLIVAAIYAASAKKQVLTGAHLFEEIQLTKPLSVVMDKQINALRDWAKDRTVSAN